MNKSTVTLGEPISLEDVISVARYGASVTFSDAYCQRVQQSQRLVEKWVQEERVMYGITTGFGTLCSESIPSDQAKQLQENIILSHATSVGESFSEEEIRAIMLMVLQNLGQGYSGVRLETLERYRFFLNHHMSPFTPKEGSVGYLSPEAHIAMGIMGKGKLFYKGELKDAKTVLKEFQLEEYALSFKEGLALVSGTTSVTAMGALALYDMLTAAKTADIIAAMSLEVSKGTTRAFDERMMGIRPHKHQQDTAWNVRTLLADSEIAIHHYNYRLQDALSLRAIPQAHGGAKKILMDAKETIEIEMNSCCDNPIIWREGDDGEAISGCNCDSGYVGLAMDSVAIAATYLGKISERRNNRLIDGNLSGNPYFLVRNAGLNSGLMIPQYTQAGLLNDMKILSTPATIDSIPTCAMQEDYVAMGYNAAKKARKIATNLEFILGIELLSAYQSYPFLTMKPGMASQKVMEHLATQIPELKEDTYLYPYINFIQQQIHHGHIIRVVEDAIGSLR